MAPTEILAEQHARRMRELLASVGEEVSLVTGSLSAPARRAALESLASGSARLVVGTHALIQEGVAFRSLAEVRSPDERDDVYERIRSEVAAGRQAYVVYPLVGESEKVDLLAATDEFERLKDDVFAEHRVGLLHGQLPPSTKDAVMRSFLAGEIDVLVTTTVIEVGIDVANASVMVVEHAERFGLAQLHQLRGRVGRGEARGYCILVADTDSGAMERLEIFRRTHDGFEVARADLRLRGQGDLFGSQQHGDPGLRFADLMIHEDLLAAAQREARALTASDPDVTKPEHARILAQLRGRYRERLEMYGVG
jgi:ATP-dependent DNA helicase RecG